MAGMSFPPVEDMIVQRVVHCDFYHRRPSNSLFISPGVPGHVLQLCVAGRVHYEVGGRTYLLGPGDLVWHHELETIKRRILGKRWSFYTLHFLAPALPPPPFERRVRRVGKAIERRFAALLAAWRRPTAAPLLRSLRVHMALAALLISLLDDSKRWPEFPFQTTGRAALWWKLENQLRSNLAAPMGLRRMVELTGRSRTTIARACQAAVGESPMRRFKRLRMSLACSLVLYTEIPVSKIAQQVGYSRHHEFSRDYHRIYGIAPRDHRRHGDDSAIVKPVPFR